MVIETLQQDYSTHEVSRIAIDDTVDLIVVKKGKDYTIKVLENNCVNINIEYVNLELV